MKTLKTKILLAMLCVVALSTMSLSISAQGTFTFGVQNPTFGKMSDRYSISNSNTYTTLDKYSDMTPYFRYRGTTGNDYWNAAIFLQFGKGTQSTIEPSGSGSINHSIETKNSSVMFEFGKGVIVPVRNSFATFGLNAMVGFQMNNEYHDNKVYNKTGNFDTRVLKEDRDLPSMFLFGIASDISYNQSLGGNIYLNLDPKFLLYYQGAVNKPVLVESVAQDGVLKSEKVYDILEWKEHDFLFKLIPSIGLTYSF